MHLGKNARNSTESVVTGYSGLVAWSYGNESYTNSALSPLNSVLLLEIFAWNLNT